METTTTKPTTTDDRLLQEFAAWVKPRKPDAWGADTEQDMRELVASFLAEQFPARSKAVLATLAQKHVTAGERRLRIDFGGIIADLLD